MIFKSLRWRLQVWHGVLLVGVLAGFGVTAYRLQRAERVRHVDQELSEQLRGLLRILRDGPRDHPGPPQRPPPGPPAFLPELFAQMSLPGGMYFVIWDRDRREVVRSTNAPGSLDFPAENRSGALEVRRTRGEWREAYSVTPPGECLLVGRSFASEAAGLRAFAGWLVVAGGAVLAVGLAGGWWLAGRAIQPIQAISATAGRIAEGRLSERIDAAEMDNELGQLATVLNKTFSRLDAAFVRQQQFTADASHELRTPVSVILSQTQQALGRDRPAAEYREALAACGRAAQRMRRLIESLLELARLDAGREAMKEEGVRLDAVVGDCITLIRPLADEQGIKVHAALAAVEVRGNTGSIAQAITNLLANAIHYNRAAGEIRVSVRQEGGFGTVEVADTGIGIAEDHLPQLFERFFRADTARSRGGAGLGLAIVKAIVDRHGGSVSVSSTLGVGTTLTVRFPGARLVPAPALGT